MTVRLLLVPIVAAAALVLAGCSEETPGDASPGDATQSGTDRPGIPTGGVPTETTEPGGESGTADLQPCELLKGGELAELSLGADGVQDDVAGQRGCLWTASGSHTVTVSIADDLGLEDVQSSGPTKEMKIGSHDAVQSTGGVSSCAINLGVTETSRVDVISAANGDEAKACDVAKQAAELVEPKLP